MPQVSSACPQRGLGPALDGSDTGVGGYRDRLYALEIT